jgi:hypothetical protein
MVRKDADCDRIEWKTIFDSSIDLSQMIDVTQEKITRPVCEGHSEEKYTAFDSRP